jgi:hypothetical protein
LKFDTAHALTQAKDYNSYTNRLLFVPKTLEREVKSQCGGLARVETRSQNFQAAGLFLDSFETKCKGKCRARTCFFLKIRWCLKTWKKCNQKKTTEKTTQINYEPIWEVGF